MKDGMYGNPARVLKAKNKYTDSMAELMFAKFILLMLCHRNTTPKPMRP